LRVERKKFEFGFDWEGNALNGADGTLIGEEFNRRKQREQRVF
jgi:hypothetical protein